MLRVVSALFVMMSALCIAPGAALAQEQEQGQEQERLGTLGVSLGDSFDSVESKLLGEGWEVTQDQTLQLRDTDIVFTHYRTYGRVAADGQSDTLRIQYSRPPSEPSVVAIDRKFTPSNAARLADSAVREGLVARYGEPQHVFQNNFASRYHWNTSTQGDACAAQHRGHLQQLFKARGPTPGMPPASACQGDHLETAVNVVVMAGGRVVGGMTQVVVNPKGWVDEEAAFNKFASEAVAAAQAAKINGEGAPEF